ncbi:MAG: hypothetical protein O2895_06220 [Chloroflexi bacterium]|nr:hypothetical protein [Chloroflexota bacterium]
MTATPTAPPVLPTPVAVTGPVTARVLATELQVYADADADSFVVGRLPEGAEVTVIGRYGRREWLAIADAGWVPYDGAALELGVELGAIGPPPTDERGAYTVVSGPPHPAATRTGVPAVDAVIEAMHAHDEDAMVALLAFQELPCVAEQAYGGGPPGCRAGDAVGTVYSVLPYASSESAWLNPDQAIAKARSLAVGGASGEPFRGYAAFGVKASPEGRARHRVVSTEVGKRRAIVFVVDNAGVTHISVPADGPIGGGLALPPAAGFEFLLPPPVPEGLLPPR